jgi:F-type H+-transporting ATPase subunit a
MDKTITPQVKKSGTRWHWWRLLWVFSGILVTTLAVVGLIARFLTARFLPGVQVVPEVDIHLASDRLFQVSGFPITNTLLSCWLAMLFVAVFFLAARWKTRLVPRGLQNISEALLEALLDFVASVVGDRKARLLFPLAATLFLFIAANAFISLLPIFGPVVAILGGGSHVPLLRGAGTDINMSLALAVVAGVVVEGLGFLAWRFSYFRQFFPVHHLLRGQWLPGAMELMAGLIKGLTHLFRLFSFTFRLFGNLTAGEILLLTTSFLSPVILGIPFYGLELLIGMVQAGIFAGLTVVFAVMAVAPEPAGLAEERDASEL